MMKLVMSKYPMEIKQKNNLHCPNCHSENVVKNGHIHNGKQSHLCKDCGRQLAFAQLRFVEDPQNVPISQTTKDLVDKLLLERLSLAAIARVAGVSESWLQRYVFNLSVNEKFENIGQEVNVEKKEKVPLKMECDEIWLYVGNKGNKMWIWLAIDQKTGETVGLYLDSRDKEVAKGLWKSLPAVYRQCAVCHSDFWASYKEVIPSKRHKGVGKKSGKTNRIERFNCTLRQRVSRLVRKTLSFSKKLANHIAAIWYFVHNYNSSLHV